MWQGSDRPRVRAAMFVFVSPQDDGKFIMQCRHNGGNPYWTIPGGEVRAGETVRETAIREVREQTNLRVQGCRTVAVTEESDERSVTFWLKSEGSVHGVPLLNKGRDHIRLVTWGAWPQPLHQPHWEGFFSALNTPHHISMMGGLR